MRMELVDRIVEAEPPHRIRTLTHVTGLDDVFADHFPGYPVLPGALIVEALLQASQLLIALSHDFTGVGRLRRLSRVAFRRPVRPGDVLAIRCARRDGADGWTIEGEALVESRRVASATLEFELEPAAPTTDAGRHAARLRATAGELLRAPVETAPRGSGR
jgi:3-hydroxyacyl-[acyl-carrier-protein] dehydratase